MRVVLFVVALAALAVAAPTNDEQGVLHTGSMLMSNNVVEQVNAAHTSWKAAPQPRFEGYTIADFKKLLGVPNDNAQHRLPEERPMLTSGGDIPDEFDSRTNWPGYIHDVLDQGQCGSCWAFGASEALSDRLAIATKGASNVVLSSQVLVSCDTSNYGCQGGYPIMAWEYMESNGLPTQDCVAYTSGTEGDSGTCPSTCDDGSAFTLYKAKSAYSVPSSVTEIQKELMAKGPIEVAFTVYEDFPHYSSGVYKHTTGQQLGGHAVKMIGWGVEDGQDYWLIQNSWGTSWGLQGLFKIARGNDECGIESQGVAGDA